MSLTGFPSSSNRPHKMVARHTRHTPPHPTHSHWLRSREPRRRPQPTSATPTRKLQPGFSADDGAQRVGGEAPVRARVPAPAGVADHQGPSVQLVAVPHARVDVAAIPLPPVETAGVRFTTISITEPTSDVTSPVNGGDRHVAPLLHGWRSRAPQLPVRNKGASAAQSATEQRLGDDGFPRSPGGEHHGGNAGAVPTGTDGWKVPESLAPAGRPQAAGEGGAARIPDSSRWTGHAWCVNWVSAQLATCVAW